MWNFDITPNGLLNALKYETSKEIFSDPILVPLTFGSTVLMASQQDHRLVVDSRTFTLPVPVPFGSPPAPTPMLVDEPQPLFKYNQQTSTTDLSFYARSRKVVFSTPPPPPTAVEKCDRSTNVAMDEPLEELQQACQRLKDLSDAFNHSDCYFCPSLGANCDSDGQ
jgi:hypothetical protein